jgi:hypothetical protein
MFGWAFRPLRRCRSGNMGKNPCCHRRTRLATPSQVENQARIAGNLAAEP